MKQQLKTVDYKWLTEPTGDPFADAGGYALKEFAERFPEKDILELIEEVTKIYVDHWGGKIKIFFLNSKITQPAFKSKEKEQTAKYFQDLINEKCSVGEGYCRISGQKTKLFIARRDNSILSGSGTFINFYCGFEPGLLVSKEMLVRFHFVPLASILVENRVTVVHSNNNLLSEYFARKNSRANLHAIAMGISEGMLKSVYNFPATAIFRFINKALDDSEDNCYKLENCCLTFYCFLAGRSIDFKLFNVPSMLFEFYSFTQRGKIKEDWNCFVAHYYRISKNKKINNIDDVIGVKKTKNTEVFEIKNNKNIIYENLLNNKSILSHIRNWSKLNSFPLEIVKLYQINIRNMNEKTYQKIIELADFIVENENVGKYIQLIKNTKTAFDLEDFIINKIVVLNYKLGNAIIITVDDYCKYLFSEEIFWKDVKNVFLIAIYQKLHEKKIHFEDNTDEEVSDWDDNEENNINY